MRQAVVAIPARDEAVRIGACLRALAQQQGPPPPDGFSVVVFANNCSDDTAAQVRALAPTLPFACSVVEGRLEGAEANAGEARRRAMELAALRVTVDPARAALLSTDADTRVRPDWLAGHLRGFAAGADAVAGEIDLDPLDGPPPPLLGLRALEPAYAELSAELVALLDPVAHDPWPNHRWGWGANLGVRLSAYRAAGGVPRVPLAEDRALVDMLERVDARVRRCRETRVWTSSRFDGRAPGGYADLLREFATDEAALCDAVLEPADLTALRARSRAALRRLHADGRLWTERGWARRLGLDWDDLSGLLDERFGETWHRLECWSPRLRRQRLRPSELTAETAKLRRHLALAQRRAALDISASATRPADTSPAARP